MSPSEIATLKKFLSQQCGSNDIQSNFQHIFRFGGFVPTPPGALCLYEPRWSFVPLKQIHGYAPVADRRTDITVINSARRIHS